MQAPSDYIFIGMQDRYGAAYPVGLSRADRRFHTYVIGKTGVGKSTLLKNIIIQDILAGRGSQVERPAGDLPRVDAGSVDRASELIMDGEHPVLVVEVDGGEDFVRPGQVMAEKELTRQMRRREPLVPDQGLQGRSPGKFAGCVNAPLRRRPRGSLEEPAQAARLERIGRGTIGKRTANTHG